MTVTISRLYNNYDDARAAVRNLEAAGVGHNDISILASNADNWYSDDRKDGTYPDRDLDGKDDRAEAAGRAQGSALLWAALQACSPGLVSWSRSWPGGGCGWLVSTLAGAAAGGGHMSGRVRQIAAQRLKREFGLAWEKRPQAKARQQAGT